MSTKDQVAQLIVTEAKARGHTRDECLAEMSCLYQESGWDETVWDPTHTTYGIAQQDASYPSRFSGAAAQIKAFFDRLDIKRKAAGHGDIWLNLCWQQQAPNWPSAQFWYDHGRRAYLTEIKSRIGTVTPYLDKYWPTSGGSVPAVDNRPSYNEYANWTKNNQSRGDTTIDLVLVHTQEGGGGDDAADDLARYIRSTEGTVNAVSYHYVLSQASDGGVTVIDCVDTDFASWSVLSANSRSINLCFAGSRAAWTREQWLKQSKAIDVAAYLAVQDCKKYGIPATVIGTGGKYSSARAGIADHRFVTDVLKDGSHTDVGINFPVDVFTTAVNKYASGLEPEVPVVVERLPQDLTDRKLWEDVWVQLRGPGGHGWPQLGQNEHGQNLTLVDAVAALRKSLES